MKPLMFYCSYVVASLPVFFLLAKLFTHDWIWDRICISSAEVQVLAPKNYVCIVSQASYEWTRWFLKKGIFLEYHEWLLDHLPQWIAPPSIGSNLNLTRIFFALYQQFFVCALYKLLSFSIRQTASYLNSLAEQIPLSKSDLV